MIVLVTGDRNWQDVQKVRDALKKLPKNTTIVHGAAKGADSIADKVAKELGFTIIPYKADWQLYGRAAGPIRNRQMFNENHPDLVIAFHPDLSKSKGTRDMVNYAKAQGTRVIHIR